jgi:putative sigma-54 modulation protein
VEIAISSRGPDVSDALDAATRSKLGRLDRYADGDGQATVHFAEEKNPRIADKAICEVTLEARGHQVHGKVTATDRFAALDLVIDKLDHQLSRLKSRAADKNTHVRDQE